MQCHKCLGRCNEYKARMSCKHEGQNPPETSDIHSDYTYTNEKWWQRSRYVCVYLCVYVCMQ